MLFELIATIISLSGALSTLLLAILAAQFVRQFHVWQKERRQATTIGVLAEYRDRINFPAKAVAEITADDFATIRRDDGSVATEGLLSYLNSMEYLSVLINGGAIDENLCKMFLRGDVVVSFSRLLSYILAARESSGNSRLFVEYESLARRWGADL